MQTAAALPVDNGIGLRRFWTEKGLAESGQPFLFVRLPR